MRTLKRGFTLIELLVVISIILIASSVIFIGSRGGEGTKLSSSQRIVSGIAQGARAQAILRNANTRLIIYSDTNTGTSADPDKMLRFFGIVYFGEDSAGQEGWIAATQGTYLPEGVYFNRALSQSNSQASGTIGTMNLDYPRTSAQTGGSDQYYYYEFNSNGTMALGFQNAWLVLQAGILRGTPLAVEFPATAADEGFNLKTGLIFRRAGTTTPVNNPGDI
ncbi:MAG: prepilin-type N-terminal cleavage/methylation domain-containing protein [Puniceicoccaceae bacterium]|nr:MAG: prepilin-type N-terminal cleavage/methylation domain-containing protein [Puniceicoccaceae bacterium]